MDEPGHDLLSGERAISSVRILVELGAEHGLRREECLNHTGISDERLEDPKATVTGAQELQVIDNLVSALPEVEGLGLQAGSRYQLTTFGIWAFAIISSPTIRSAIEVALRFSALSFVLVRFSFVKIAGGAEIRMDVDHIPRRLHPFVIERHLAVLFHFLSAIVGDAEVHPKAIHVTIERLSLATLPRTPPSGSVVLGASANRVVLDDALLDLPCLTADPATAEFCLRQCQDVLDERRARAGLSGEVRRFLLSRISDVPSLPEAAAHFHMNPRTFRRRLEEQGSSFRELTEEARAGVAIELLTTARLSVESVTERLGYAETASFIHAFKRWTGTTPGRYRRKAS